MSMIFSRGCEYAFQAILYLASQPPERPILQRDISSALNIPPHFLGKVLQLLSRSNLVISQKGKSGGFVLGRAAEDIYLYDILEATDGAACLDGCILGFSECGDENPCPLHPQWKQNKEKIIEMLQSRNTEELSKELQVKLDSLNKNNTLSIDNG
jgi:Rrf2 family protein